MCMDWMSTPDYSKSGEENRANREKATGRGEGATEREVAQKDGIQEPGINE